MNSNETVCIVGRIDCTKVTLIRYILQELKKRKENKYDYNIVLAFETPFEFYIDELIKKNAEIMNYSKSPLIYIEDSKGSQNIIGNFEEFMKWAILNFSYYEDRNHESFKDHTIAYINKYVLNRGYKYAFLDIKYNSVSFKVVVELFHNICPQASINFLGLCKGFVNQDKDNICYKGTKLDRIVPNGWIQGGRIKASNLHNN